MKFNLMTVFHTTLVKQAERFETNVKNTLK